MNRHISFYSLIPIITCIFLFFTGCETPTDESQEHESWSSSHPLSISYRTRYQKHTQGNLVHNPSFESGKVKQVDSLTQSIVIEGWDFVGKNIRWLKVLGDSNSASSPYIHSGLRAIKILKEDANETDEIGDGIISDYIRVIPGNYNLSMYLNLVDIENPKSRLGTGLYDAVDLRIIYYDKNKISLSGKQYSPFHGNYFDNSFKGESLAKFNRIDSTGWIHVQGRSHRFPVPDGDIQDNAKYIRIFIGLKGNGTLYIDDVNYEYTRWNFTQLERLEPYFDSVFSLGQLIIPAPRSVKILESIIYYRPYYKDVFPVILVPANSDKITLQAARFLETQIQQTISSLTNTELESIPRLITSSISDQTRRSTVTFSIGKTNLFKEASSSIPMTDIENEEQGFIIHTLKDDLSVIYLVGNSPIANYYAVQAAVQLFDNRRLLFHNANIIDFPENEIRPILFSEFNEYNLGVLQMNKVCRFNQVYLPVSTNHLEEHIKSIASLGTHGIWLFANFAFDSDAISSGTLTDIITRNQGKTEGFAILDEPISNIKSSKIKNNSNNDPVVNLTQLVATDYELEIQSNQNSINVLPNNLTGLSELGFKSLGNISYIWTGFGINSWKLDEADYLYFQSGIKGKNVFIDFTMLPKDRTGGYFMYDSLWPYKMQQASLFEAYDNEVVDEVFEKADKVVLSYKLESVFNKIRLQTASEFYWNSSGYNPDLSIYRALITAIGVKAAKDLIYFNDLYFKARSELLLAKATRNLQKHIRKADGYMKAMKDLQETLILQPEIQKQEEFKDLLRMLQEELEQIRIELAGSYNKTD